MSAVDRKIEILLKQRGWLLTKLKNRRPKSQLSRQSRRRSIIIPSRNDDHWIEIIIPEGALCIIMTSVLLLLSGLK